MPIIAWGHERAATGGFLSGLLHAGGIGIGLTKHWQGGAVVLRALGAAVAAGGVWFLAGGTG